MTRKKAYNTFSSVDTAQINWKSTNPKVLTINDKGETGYQFAKTGKTIIQAIDSLTGKILAETQVTVQWEWWQWILVVLLFGWIYL